MIPSSSRAISRARNKPVLKRIGFYNTKAFQGWQEIPVKTFNLVYGQNSAGKSSLLHSILWVYEVLRNQKINIKNSSLARDFVDFGGIKQFINKNDPKNKKIGFSLTFVDTLRSNFLYSLQWLINDFIGVKNSESKTDKNVIIQINKITRSVMATILSKKFDQRPNQDPASWDEGYENLEIKIEVMFDLDLITLHENIELKIPNISFYLNNVRVFCLTKEQEMHINDDSDEKKFRDEKEIKSTIDGEPASILVSNKLQYKYLAQKIEETYRILKKKNSDSAIMELFEETEIRRRDGFVQNHLEPKAFENQICASLNLSDFKGGNTGLEVFPSSTIRQRAMAQNELFATEKMPEDQAALFILEAIGDTLQKACKGLFQRPKYLAAYRMYPKRFVSEYDLLGSDNGDPFGSDSLNILLDGPTRKKLNKACKDLGAEFEFLPGDAHREVGSILKIVSKSESGKQSFSYRDIGFGWSQVVPVLFELIKEEFSIFMCEQPELHLHPSAQSKLMEVIVSIYLNNRSLAQKEEKPTILKPIFFELHSEQMILRLLKMLKTKVFETTYSNPGFQAFADDFFSILYVERKDGRTKVREIGIKSNGTLTKEWPGGILGSAISDLQYEQ